MGDLLRTMGVTDTGSNLCHLLAWSWLGTNILLPLSVYKLCVSVSSCHPKKNKLLDTSLSLSPFPTLQRVHPKSAWQKSLTSENVGSHLFEASSVFLIFRKKPKEILIRQINAGKHIFELIEFSGTYSRFWRASFGNTEDQETGLNWFWSGF